MYRELIDIYRRPEELYARTGPYRHWFGAEFAPGEEESYSTSSYDSAEEGLLLEESYASSYSNYEGEEGTDDGRQTSESEESEDPASVRRTRVPIVIYYYGVCEVELQARMGEKRDNNIVAY